MLLKKDLVKLMVFGKSSIVMTSIVLLLCVQVTFSIPYWLFDKYNNVCTVNYSALNILN